MIEALDKIKEVPGFFLAEEPDPHHLMPEKALTVASFELRRNREVYGITGVDPAITIYATTFRPRIWCNA